MIHVIKEDTIKVNKRIRDKANAIVQKYNKWLLPKDLRMMYDELSELGITVGMLTNRKENNAGSWYATCEWYYQGQEVENSMFYFSVYEGDYSTDKNEYTIYFT